MSYRVDQLHRVPNGCCEICEHREHAHGRCRVCPRRSGCNASRTNSARVIAGVVVAIAYLLGGMLLGKSAEEALAFAIRMVEWIAGSLALAALFVATGRAWERTGPVARAIRESAREETRVRVGVGPRGAGESAVEIEIGGQGQGQRQGQGQGQRQGV